MDSATDIGLYSLKPAGWFRVFSYLSSAEHIVSRLALWKVACIADERLTYQLATPKRGVLAIRWCALPASTNTRSAPDHFLDTWEHQYVPCPSLNNNGMCCTSCNTCKRGIRQMAVLIKESAKLQFDLIRRNLLEDGGDISTLILDMRLLRYVRSWVDNDDCPIKISVIQFARLVNDISAKYAASIQHLIYIEDGYGHKDGDPEPNKLLLPAQVHKLVRLDRMLATMSNLRAVYMPSIREYEAANVGMRLRTHRTFAWEALESLAPERRLASVQLIVMETSGVRDLVLSQFGGTCTVPDLPGFNGLINVGSVMSISASPDNDITRTPFRDVANKMCAPYVMDFEIRRISRYNNQLINGSLSKEFQRLFSNGLKEMLADLWQRTSCVWRTVHGHPRFFKFGNSWERLQRIISNDAVLEGWREVVASFSSAGLSFLDACTGLRKRSIRYNDSASSRPALWHGGFKVNLFGTESVGVALLLHVRYDWHSLENEEELERQLLECQQCLLAVLVQLIDRASNARQRTISRCTGESADFCDLLCQNLRELRLSFRGADEVESVRPHCLKLERRMMEEAAEINMRVMEEKGFIPLPRLKKIKVGWESSVPDSFVWF